MPQLRPYKIHPGCGGRLVYTDNELGYTGYLCLSCGWWHPKNKYAKGGSPMPFDKNAKEAGEKARELRGSPLSEFEGTTLLLRSYTTRESGNFGQLAVLECEDEDGKEVKLSTFSGIVINQLEEIEGHLPLLIHPQKVSNYYTIF